MQHPQPLKKLFLLSSFPFLFLVSFISLVHAENPLFSNIFSPDSLMGAGAASRGAPSSTPAGFSDQSSYVQLSSSGTLVAVGDFNRDRFIDLVMLDSKTLRDVSIMFWDHDAFSFKHSGKGVSLKDFDAEEKEKKVKPMRNIIGVHVGDFGNDGTLDLLLHDGEQGRLFYGDGMGNFNATQPLVIPEMPYTSAVIDANTDLVPDIFVAFKNGTRGFWVSQPNETLSLRQGEASSGTSEEATTKQKGGVRFEEWPGGQIHDADGRACEVVDPVSIAFVDLDGDCLADLVIPTSCGVEMWSNPADAGKAFWELKASRSGPSDLKNVGLEVFNYAHGDRAMAFADFNSDGTIDIAVPNSNRQDLLIHLNIQRKRRMDALCVKDAAWTLERRVGLSTGMNLRTAKVGGILNHVDVPSSLHVGDYDLDGLADILSIDASSTRPVIFRNLGRWEDRKTQDSHFKRMDRKEEQGLSNGNSGAVSGMFFDTDESGRQDILVVRKGNETRLIWNNMRKETDSLFFKGTVLSGLPYRQLPRPFSPVVGDTMKISYMERGSRSRVTRMCSQCGQGGLWQLRACNCQFGLMQIANYIEALWVGAGGAQRQWTNLMPNSMAVVWAEKGESRKDASGWWMEYFTQRRGGQMLRVSALLVASLAVLSVAILVLQQRESKEDREEEQERVRLFNFV